MKKFFLSVIFFVPSVSYANGLYDFQILIVDIISRLSSLFFAIAVAFFVYGVAKFIGSADDTAEREKGRKFIVWAIISFVVIVSIWGLVGFLLGSFGFASGGTPGWITD